MRCPYVCNISQVNQNRYEYDKDGRNTFHEHKPIEEKSFVPCLEEECGAGRNGRCCYFAGREDVV